MDKKNNSNCVTCGEGYHCCLSCGDSVITSWRYLACSPEHFKIYMIICDYRDKIITKQKEKEMLSHVDIACYENYKEDVRHIVLDILSDDVF